MSALPPLQITRVLANAGSGKTHKLSADFLRVAHSGLIEGDLARVESILATTFTRASARDIRNKVLLRVADAVLDRNPLHHGARGELAESIFGNKARSGDVKCEELLDVLVQRLDRLEIRTIDGFFNRLASAYSLELGLSPGTTPVDDSKLQKIHMEALARVIQANPADAQRLLRTTAMGKGKRDLATQLLDGIGKLLEIWRDSQSDDESVNPSPAWVRTDEVKVVDISVARKAIKAIAGLVGTMSGSNQSEYERVSKDGAKILKSVDDGRSDIESLKKFLSVGIPKKLIQGDPTYNRKPIDPSALPHFEDILEWARGVITVTALRSSIAQCELAQRLDEEVRSLLFQAGACTFDSITRSVSRSLAKDTLGDMLYRLDGRIDHLLLDEFQDTSLAQWRALKPLAESIASGGENARSILAVGDAKQSIYGWRNGDPRLLRGLAALLNESGHADVRDETLATSWRSAPVVLQTVDRVFRSLLRADHPARDPDDKNYNLNFVAALERWMDKYADHIAAPKNATLSGCVRFVETEKGLHLAAAAAKASELWRRSGGRLKIAVIAPRNKDVGLIAQAIRNQPDAPPCALLAGGELSASPAVVALIDAIRFAAHPDDLVSLLSVLQSPLAQVWGLQLPTDWSLASQSNTRFEAAQKLRLAFASNSIAATVCAWVSKLDRLPSGTPLDDGDRRRITKLISEISSAEEGAGTLDDLIGLLDAVRMQDVPSQSIHAINIHQSKGLEWDIVIFVAPSNTSSPRYLMAVGRGGEYRGPESDRIAPKISAGLALPEVQEVIDSADQFAFQEFLSSLYVAITRAKRGLWVYVENAASKKDPPTITRSHGGILRFAMSSPIPNSKFQNDESWIDAAAVVTDSAKDEESNETANLIAPPMPARPKSPRVQTRVARSASALSEVATREDEMKVDAVDPLSSRNAMAYGSIAHAVCESVEWIDEWHPDEPTLVARATALAPFFTAEKIQAAVAHVVKQLRAGKIAASLSRPKDSAIAVRERQFLHFNEGGGLRQGAIDRIVLHGKPRAWTRIEIVDFKTDRPLVEGDPNWSTSRADHHRPQLHAYREAVAAEYNVDPKIISTSIVLLSSGEVIDV